MYFYYTLTCLGFRPTWKKILTTMQIVQFVVGNPLGLIYAILPGCLPIEVIPPENVIGQILGSQLRSLYACLFVNTFFISSLVVLFTDFSRKTYGTSEKTEKSIKNAFKTEKENKNTSKTEKENKNDLKTERVVRGKSPVRGKSVARKEKSPVRGKSVARKSKSPSRSTKPSETIKSIKAVKVEAESTSKKSKTSKKAEPTVATRRTSRKTQ